ncbi:hypothetical protein AX769_03395 [Frondihabitans sp. PAMC 28766]|uniref:helix-turn-helix domain-containing protein n=1 Tax=Frondihabitans sp. PAMC 28766 TaxID=1795630 RepID=UPI00078C2FA3|nr:helix-turn-helix domain-containing protein [Frondihabitans sp. PAMC 28766]AMM19351.1 hypothetical protein AX769_03395 [Frondihabitans sp. PAMC 28766]
MSTTLPPKVGPLGDTCLDRIEVSGTEFEELNRLAGRFYGGARIRAVDSDVGRPFPFRFASLGDEQVALRLSTLTAGIVGEVERLDDYVVTWFRTGGGTVTTRGASIDLPVGRPFVLPSASSFTFEVFPGRQNLVHVARPFLDDIATEFHGGPAQPIAFQHRVSPTDEGSASWRQTIASATPVITDPEASPLIRMEANMAVARSMLAVFAWHTDHLAPVLLMPRLRRVREAVEFLHDNAHLPITPADAAAAAGLHTRSMQTAFQRHLGMSPTEYLRCVRLDRVRRDLVEHDPETATVSDLARAWGFGNLGRFAAAYQARFGEKPNETLRCR